MNVDDLPDRRPVSMTPAPPGWRAVVVGEDSWWDVPVVGWELVENTRTDRYSVVTEDLGPDWRAREWRIRVAVMDDLLVDLEDYYGDRVWMLLGPHDKDPTNEAVAEERERMDHLRASRHRSAA